MSQTKVTLIGDATAGTLTRDGLTTKVGAGDVSFHAGTTASQSIPNGTYTKLTFGTEAFDRGGNFASSTFTAPKAGVYLFTAFARFDNVAIDRIILVPYKNGSNIGGQYISNTAEKQMTTAAYTSVECTQLFSLSATDTFEIYIYQNSGGSANAFEKTFNGFRVGTFD